MNVESKGRYLNSHIKGQYEATGYELRNKQAAGRSIKSVGCEPRS